VRRVEGRQICPRVTQGDARRQIRAVIEWAMNRENAPFVGARVASDYAGKMPSRVGVFSIPRNAFPQQDGPRHMDAGAMVTYPGRDSRLRDPIDVPAR